MKKVIALICLSAMLFTLAACSGKSGFSAPEEKIEGSMLYVKKVENLPGDFILGVDVSSVLSEEASGVKYYNFNGEEQDLFRTLAESGVTHIRVRVWNDPRDENGNSYGGGNCDVDCACEIGRRAAEYGMKLIVDFHYSDFWADPGKQTAPKAWQGMSIEDKTEALYQYTKDSLEKLLGAGADVGMVQIGNETNGAICGEKTWFNMQYLFNAGAKAVREVCPEALVALHFANPERSGAYADYAWRMDYYSVDYDVFATSYYPYWHGTLDNLASVLTEIAEKYGKKVMVMETSYAFTPDDTDFSGNTISDGGAIVKDYPFTVQGQANCFRNVVDTIANKTKNGIGVVYWEGAWITVGTNSWEENSAIWEKYGSGWATRFAGGYDADAGLYYGGSAVDNQAFFDASGKPLESLKVFNLVRYGNEIEAVPDAIADTNLIVDLNGTLELPATVDAVMTDDSKQAVPVTWNVTDGEIAKMFEAGAGKYTVTGNAGDLDANCYISLVEFNFLENYSFETGDLTGWIVEDNGGADELYVENKVTDSLTGTYHMHFWSAKKNTVDFTLEQEVKDLPSGKYKFSLSIMGGDGGEQDSYVYVKIDGETVATCPVSVTYYNEWCTGTVTDIEYEAGQSIAVGVRVKCAGEGSGAWGKIDDAMLNSMA